MARVRGIVDTLNLTVPLIINWINKQGDKMKHKDPTDIVIIYCSYLLHLLAASFCALLTIGMVKFLMAVAL